MTAAGSVPRELVPLARALGVDPEVVTIASTPSVYRTSHRVLEVTVTDAGGEQLDLVVKDFGVDALTPAARRAKPSFLYDPLREIEVYLDVLASAGLSTAALHTVVLDGGLRLLAIERVHGHALAEEGDLRVWCGAAAWLAEAHRRLRARRTPRLVRWDGPLVRRWWERARRLQPDATVARVADRSGELARRLLALPTGLLHGELFASNVLVCEDGRVCPVDWELAGVGPHLLDLAALVAGGWSDVERREIALSYRAGLPAPPAEEVFLGQLDLCRLQLAGQLLGWSGSWQAPTEHAHDWLSDVRALAPRLGLA